LQACFFLSLLIVCSCADMVPEGLDQGVQRMKPGETAVINVPPSYGYGDVGRAAVDGGVAVPPGATLSYEVTLVATENSKESWELKDDEKVAAAAVRKDKVG
jgi:FK506-binding protein 4/5